MWQTPKNLATSPALGGTVDRKVSPMKAANTSTTGPVLGASKKASTATARAAQTSASRDFMRQLAATQPRPRISAPATGAMTNWPNEPPALTS